jgi:hypothetical protein
VTPAIQNFKLRWWEHDAHILHSSQIRRQEPPFAFLKSVEKRENFMADLISVIECCPFTIVAGVIHKQRHRDQYVTPINPYSLALTFCMERTYAFLREHGQQQNRATTFIFEKRGKREDEDLELVFRRTCDGANLWGTMPGFTLRFEDKKANLPGLQVADLVGTPIGQHVHQPEQPNRAYEAVATKFRKSPAGVALGYGFKVFP